MLRSLKDSVRLPKIGHKKACHTYLPVCSLSCSASRLSTVSRRFALMSKNTSSLPSPADATEVCGWADGLRLDVVQLISSNFIILVLCHQSNLIILDKRFKAIGSIASKVFHPEPFTIKRIRFGTFYTQYDLEGYEL